MSHITDIEQTCVITDVEALKLAIKAFCPDLEYVEGEKHYRTWKDNHGGKLVGDWKLPNGMTEADVGENAKGILRLTDAALKKQGHKNRTDSGSPYEIGLVPVTTTRDKNDNVVSVKVDPHGKERALMTDFWAQGNGIMRTPGIGQHNRKYDKATGKHQDTSFEDLYMHYRMMQAKREAQRNGDQIQFDKQQDGTYIAKVNTQLRLGC